MLFVVPPTISLQEVHGFGVDLFMQGASNESNLVFLQGCCQEFINEFFERLK